MAKQLARRRQRERLAGIVVVCIGIAVLAVAVFALREPKGHVSAAGRGASNVAKQSARSHSTPSASEPQSSAHATSDTQSSSRVKQVPLVVLNNTTIAGLASAAAHRFESGGWTVTDFGNYQNTIASTCAYYDPSTSGAKAAARALQRQYPTIKRIAPKFAPDPGAEPLPDGPVVVVLTQDYSAA